MWNPDRDPLPLSETPLLTRLALPSHDTAPCINPGLPATVYSYAHTRYCSPHAILSPPPRFPFSPTPPFSPQSLPVPHLPFPHTHHRPAAHPSCAAYRTSTSWARHWLLRRRPLSSGATSALTLHWLNFDPPSSIRLHPQLCFVDGALES